jgi:hypothetical protein
MSLTVTRTSTATIPSTDIMKPVVDQWLAADLEESKRIDELAKQKPFRHRDKSVVVVVVYNLEVPVIKRA